MKRIKTFALLAAIATIAVFSSAVQPQPGYMLTGRWRTPEGAVVDVSKDGTHLTATFVSGGDCPFGAKRTTYFEAEITGKSCENVLLGGNCKDLLKGSMERCTMSEELLKECDLPAVYSIYFEATGTPNIIDVTWKNEHYSEKTEDKSKDGSGRPNQNNDDKKRCRWTRDPSGDKKLEFKLIRYSLRGGKKCLGRRCG